MNSALQWLSVNNKIFGIYLVAWEQNYLVKFHKLDTTGGEESTDATGGSDDWWMDVEMLIYDTYDVSADGEDNNNE